jgi:hypothetical protein
MIAKPHNQDVFRIEVLVPSQVMAEQQESRSVKVLFVVDDGTPALAMSGHVANSPPAPVIRGEGEPLFRLQVDVSVQDVVKQWNALGASRPTCAPQVAGTWGQPQYRMGRMIGTRTPADPQDRGGTGGAGA